MKIEIYNKYRYIFAFVCFVFFPPPILEAIVAGADYLFLAAQLVVMFFVIIIDVYLKIKINISKYEIIIILFGMYGCILNGFLSSETFFTFARNVAFPLFAVTIVVNLGALIDLNEMLNSLSAYFICMIWLNFFTLLFFQNGIIRSSMGASVSRAFWLLGSKNMIVQMLPIYLWAVLYLLIKKRNKMFLLTLVITLISFTSMGPDGFKMLGGSTTALVVIGLYLVISLFSIHSSTKIIHELLANRICIIVSIGLSFLTYWISQGRIKILNSVFSIMGKDYTFSRRNSVWAAAVRGIITNGFIGIGNALVRLPLGNIYTYSIYSFWMSNLLRYGLIGCLLIIFLFISADGDTEECDSKLIIVTHISVFFMMIVGLMNELIWENIALILAINKCITSRKRF